MSKVVHFEIAADDPEKLAQFYTDVFEWKIKEWKREEVMDEANRYWIIEAGPKEEIGANGGIYKRQKPLANGGSNAFVCNIAVDDILATVRKIRENGGKAEEIMEMPDIGKSASSKDPEGNMFVVFEPDPNAKMEDM